MSEHIASGAPAQNTAANFESARLLELLKNGEQESAYGDPLVKLSSGGHTVFVISDTHMGPGRDRDGCFKATENFFADEAFERFLRHISAIAAGPATLVINGDLVDFIRITNVPGSEQDYLVWQTLLAELGIQKTAEQLSSSISKKERTYGLETDDWKSVWKLDRAFTGHPHAYRALADWLAKGHRLVIVKGNHDLEWYWPLVRNFFRLRMAQSIASVGPRGTAADALTDFVLPNLTFIDNALLFDSVVYIEHGHRYDRYTLVLGNPVLPNKVELNLPFGSFLNRYMLNTVELAFPYTDNVRPASNLLALLFREDFFVALKLLFLHLPFMVLIIPKGYYRYLFTKVLVFAAILIVFGIGIPAVLVLSDVVDPSFFTKYIPLGVKFPGSTVIGSMLSVAASYFLSRLAAYFQLSEPSSLAPNAHEILNQHPEYKLVTMGHTHNPDQFRSSRYAYFNTGTWIPIIELDTAQVREDQTYTFLRFRCAFDGADVEAEMARWNDDATRVDDLVIRKPKPDTD